MLYALKVGSPPDWDNVPDEFQVDLAALDRMEDEALWKIRSKSKDCSRDGAVQYPARSQSRGYADGCRTSRTNSTANRSRLLHAAESTGSSTTSLTRTPRISTLILECLLFV